MKAVKEHLNITANTNAGTDGQKRGQLIRIAVLAC